MEGRPTVAHTLRRGKRNSLHLDGPDERGRGRWGGGEGEGVERGLGGQKVVIATTRRMPDF